MASRVFSGLQVIGPNRVRITGIVTFGAAGAPSVEHGAGFTISRSSPGTLTITFDDLYTDMEYVNMNFISCNVTQNYMVSVSPGIFNRSTSELLFLVGPLVLTGFVPGDPSNGDDLAVEFIMKNTGITGV